MKTSLWIKYLRCREEIIVVFCFLFLFIAGLFVAEMLIELYPFHCFAVIIAVLLIVWLFRSRQKQIKE